MWKRFYIKAISIRKENSEENSDDRLLGDDIYYSLKK